MKPITTDTFSLEHLIDGGYLYVDKTAHLRRLIDGKRGYQFFLARPRRFGKSLAISTFQAIFECRRELFKNLAIGRSDYSWEKYPVIRLDMAATAAETLDEFKYKVNEQLHKNCLSLQLKVDFGPSIDVNFARLMASAAASTPAGQVVVLIDEYDKPLLGHLLKETVEPFRNALKSFYAEIKHNEGIQRFTFITGVTKFSKVSIFSDLNNLTDLTLSSETATLFGYTHEEVKAYFSDHLTALAKAKGITFAEAFDRAIEMYDGYRFHANAERVVNPVSLGRCLAEQEFKSYWYETGTPTFLVNILKRRPMNISKMELDESQLAAYEPADPQVESLLFQTGYLTIARTEQLGEMTLFTLDFPNKEVRNAFNSSLMPAYTACQGSELKSAQGRCVRALYAHELDDFFEAMSVFFAGIPYDLTGKGGEKIWQTIFYTIFRFIGVAIEVEVETNRGRIDAVIKCPDEIYVIEMKLDQPPEAALAQIESMGYAEQYRDDGRRVTLLGISFSSDKRSVVGWLSVP